MFLRREKMLVMIHIPEKETKYHILPAVKKSEVSGVRLAAVHP